MLPLAGDHIIASPFLHLTQWPPTTHILSRALIGFLLHSQETIASPHICSMMQIVCPAIRSIALSACSGKDLMKPLKNSSPFLPTFGQLTPNCHTHPTNFDSDVFSQLSKISLLQKAKPFNVTAVLSFPLCTRFKTLFRGGPGK